MSLPLDAHRVLRQAMLRRMAEEQRAREDLARCREQAPRPCGRIVMTVLIATCAALIAWLLMP